VNKAAGIGIIIAIIIGIVVIAGVSMDSSIEEKISIPEETIPEETIPEETIPEETIPEETIPEETIPEETIPEEVEQQGRDLSVEFSETINLRNP